MKEQAKNVEVESVEGAKQVYELALKQREFEIAQLTQRNNFFMIFQGVLIGGLVQSQGTAAPLINFMLCFTGMIISFFQIGMAGGAKYWQTRWEVAVKDMELHLLESMKDNRRRMHQLFTVDGKHMGGEEKKRLEDINSHPARKEDQLTYSNNFIHNLVVKDLDQNSDGFLGKAMIFLAVKPKWSVSKIPLWVGFFLSLFWFALWLNTFEISGKSIPHHVFDKISKDIFSLRSFK